MSLQSLHKASSGLYVYIHIYIHTQYGQPPKYMEWGLILGVQKALYGCKGKAF